MADNGPTETLTLTVELTVRAGSDPIEVADAVLDHLCAWDQAPYESCDGGEPPASAYHIDTTTRGEDMS